jgi:nonribosomal peptide synthetase protein BlmIII
MDTLNLTDSVLLSPDQQDLWARVNDTAAGAAQTTVWALFAERAAAQPGEPAVIAARRTLTYRELAGSAEAIAARLGQVAPGATVAICAEPGWEQAAAVVGALRAGIPFCPLDPQLTQAARWRALADLNAAAVLTQSWLDERLEWPDGPERIAVDRLAQPGPAPGGAGPLPAGTADPGSVACLLAPEAAASPLPVSNGALADTITGLAGRFGLGPADRVLTVTALGDPVSVCAMTGMLAAGGAVVMPDDIDLHEPPVWVTLMQRERVTLWHSPPTLAALLAEHLQIRGEGVPESLRVVLLGGEPLTPSLAARLRRQLGPDVRIANLGGGIPAGLWVSCQEIGEAGQRRGHIPVGTPLPGKHLYVLTDALTLCPVWVSGRIYLGSRSLTGPGLAGLPGSREPVFRTELTGRLLPDGTIDVVAEDAARITVQGHPLNLRDVESALAGHDAVLLAAVVPAGDGCVAYVKPAPGAAVTGPELLDYLRTRMSPYLLPARVELVYAFQLTPGGRIDRAALAAMAAPPAGGPPGQPAPAALSGQLTERACALTAQILGVAEVEPTMNLADLGATSVQLVRLAVQAEQELGVFVDVEELLRFPSVAVLLSAASDGDVQQEAAAGPQDGAAASPQPAQQPDRQAAPPADPADVLILDPVERTAFKDGRPALRRDLDAAPAVDLVRPAAARERLGQRATCRLFRPEPVPRDQLGRLLRALGSLGPVAVDGAGTDAKYAYPSAGSLYPVQTYLSAAPGLIEDVPGGVYYYHPVRHRLLLVTADAQPDAAAHAWINRAAFRSAAFSLYLVAHLGAITPLYGSRSRDYCLIEAGAMCQLLMTEAAGLGLGLCPVGEMDFAAISGAFGLPGRSELLHILLGGLLSEGNAGATGSTAETAMLHRVSLLGQDGPAADSGPR